MLAILSFVVLLTYLLGPIYVFVLFLSLQFNYLFAYILGNDNINQRTSVFPFFFSEFSNLVIVFMFRNYKNDA